MSKTLYVTDFDDTLVHTDAMVVLVIKNGDRIELSPAQYAEYEKQDGDTFDYSEFEQLKNPRPVQKYVNLLKKVIKDKKADKIAVLTARNHTAPVVAFLKSQGITSGVSIAAIGNSDPQKKANYVEKHIKDGFTTVTFLDDAKKNVDAVGALGDKYKNVKVTSHHVTAKESTEPVDVFPVKKGDENYKVVDGWIRNKHYLKKWPRAHQEILGVRVNGKLSGVLVYGIGTRGQAATDIFGGGTIANNQMWELQRAFTTDEAKKEIQNLGSMVISKGNEYVRTNSKTMDGKPIKAIVSYADSAQGHAGSVYKSTNALYLGEQPPLPSWKIEDPKTGNVVNKSVLKKSTFDKLSGMGYKITKGKPETGKHKFVYVLGKDQRERDALMAKIVKPLFSYPKDGEKPKQIQNPAKDRMSKKTTGQQTQKDVTKTSAIRTLLKSKVKNPDTGNDILVKTALTYDKTRPSYRQAMGMVNAYAKKHNINLKANR